MDFDQPSQQSHAQQAKQGFGILFFASSTLAACVTPFTRTNWGLEYPGFPGLCAFCLMVIVAGNGKSTDLMVYSGVWLVMLIVRRCQAFRQHWNGFVQHSAYSGDAYLIKLPFIKSNGQARALEAVIVLVTGYALLEYTRVFAMFLMYCGLGLIVVRVVEFQAMWMRVRRMKDAEIEQKYTSDLYRGRRQE